MMRSGQDGGVGRNASFPRTTKRRRTTNLKSINNQKGQKTKTAKLHGTPTTKKLKKKSTRTTSPVGEEVDCKGGASWGKLQWCGWAGWRWKWDSRVDCGLQHLLRWVKLPVSHESSLESVLEASRWAALFPLWPFPNRQQQEGLPSSGEYPRPRPLQLNRRPKQRNMAQMKQHSKTPERELSDEEIANLSDGI